MQIEPLEVYSSESNYAIIKPPGRHFPGCVIQGDSLRILCQLSGEIARFVAASQIEDEDLKYQVEELNNSLVDRLLHYQSILSEHAIKLPYMKPVSENDLFNLVAEGE